MYETVQFPNLVDIERLISPNGIYETSSDHSGLMPANLITFAHFSTSAVMKV